MRHRPAARLTIALLALLAVAAPAASAQAPYAIPPDNPYVNTPGARGEIYVYGMRNPYRWSFDRLTGDLYVGDVGGIQEEVTFLPRTSARGANLGWNCLSGTAVQSPCTPSRYVGPAHTYPSSGAVVIGGYVSRAPSLPAFAGRYLYAQFTSGIYDLGPQAGQNPTQRANVASISSLGEDGTGNLYATSLAGPLYRLGQGGGGALTTTPIGNFAQPVAIAAPPGDPSRLFVVEKAGRVQLRRNGSTAQFIDLSALVGDTGGEEGLLAMAVAPDYATSGRVFVFYTDNGGDLQLDEFRRTSTSPEQAAVSSRRPVLTVQHDQASNHDGGQLLFGPDGKLYLSTGDGGTQGDPEGDAQNLGSLLGKLLRIEVGVTAPPSPVAPPAPAAPDTTAPRLRIRVRRRQRVLRLRGVVAWARCSEACTIAGRGALRIGKRRFRLRRAVRSARLAARAAQPTRRTRIKLRLTRRGTRALRRAVRHGRRPLARIRLRAIDAAGNRSRPRRAVVRVKVRPARRRRG
jgi:glucose/arabinose dehydrogenase